MGQIREEFDRCLLHDLFSSFRRASVLADIIDVFHHVVHDDDETTVKAHDKTQIRAVFVGEANVRETWRWR